MAKQTLQEQISTAVVIESFRKDIEFIKLQLITLVQNQEKFTLKTELEETKKDFNKTIQDIRDGFSQHNLDDKKSFGDLADGQEKVRDIVIRWGGGLAVIIFILSFLSPLILKYFFHI